jgi:hypothetical protein|tara:strand:- start:1538 stop:2044 length:507 start_codon:yes stop_codon:yes gene_type:complete
MKENIFDASIPGQSLTNTPGNYPWEHAPQFTSVDEASEYVWNRLHTEKMLDQVITFLKNGIPVEAIARMILFGGFAEGKWNVDVALLISEVVFNQILAIGMRAQIPNIKMFIKDQSNAKFHKAFTKFKTMENKEKEEKPSEERLKQFVSEVKEELQEQPSGLMAKGDA